MTLAKLISAIFIPHDSIRKPTYPVLTFLVLARIFRIDEHYQFNKLAQAVTTSTCIRDLAGSNLGVDTDHPH